MKPNACIIIPFFGKWPKHFPLFLKSCSYNISSIQYLIFSDIPPPKHLPENVRIIPFSLSDFNIHSSKKLGIPINISSPYKLCDFKPAYGFLFAEYIKEFKYWGHGDEDLILGKISDFITSPIEMNYDIISFRKEWVSGSFCLYKNTQQVNTLFMKSISYPDIFLSPEHFAFDECFKLWAEIINGEDILRIDKKESMTYLIKKSHNEGVISTYFKTTIKESINNDNFITFDHGKLYQKDGREFLAYHYVTEKKSPTFTYPKWNSIPDKFYINNTGFFKEEEWFNPIRKTIIINKRKIVGGVYFIIIIAQKIIKKILTK